ncbi:MAG TPA: rubrerythrin [Gammaproteobacteria bacterium]|nr:rubrerythrin [Gammaproteobacteria bacterium]
MEEHPEGHSEAYARIRSKKTLGEILEVATTFEQKAFEFYTALIPKVSKNLRYLVEELAEEEKEHYELFRKLADNPEIENQIQQRIQVPVEDHHFSDYVQLPDLGEHPDDQAILQYAMGREDAAMKQYRELADSTEPGPIHDLFEYLAYEETMHKRELEKLYYQTVYSGGPGNN